MKKIAFLFFTFLMVTFSVAENLYSPDKNFKLEFAVNALGEPVYSLAYKEKPVIQASKLGFELKNQGSLRNGFSIKNTKIASVDDSWKPVWGEVKEIRNTYNELLVELEQKTEDRTMKIRFRLFNDGLGFRYEFDKQPKLNYFRIVDECTQFALTGDHKTFWIPGAYDTNEYYYSTTKLSEVDGSTVDGNGIGTRNNFV